MNRIKIKDILKVQKQFLVIFELKPLILVPMYTEGPNRYAKAIGYNRSQEFGQGCKVNPDTTRPKILNWGLKG